MDTRKNFNSQEDIIEYLRQETKLPRDQLELIIKDFWKQVRHYISNPTESKSGILLNRFAKFYIKPYTLKRKIKTCEEKNITPKKLELYKKLLDQL